VISRRTVLGVLALALLAVPLAAMAQPQAKVPRIGFLRGTTPQTSFFEAFRQGLRELGYIEGQNLTIEQRYANGAFDRLPALAAELVRLGVDLIVVGGTADAQAAKAATAAVPIVFTLAGDPVGSGLVASLARPGGNVTGLSNQFADLGGKQFQLLKEAVPHVSRVAVLYNPENPAVAPTLRGAQAAARSLAVEVQIVETRRPNELGRAFSAIARGRAGALVTLADPVFSTARAQLVELAAKSRLPAMFFERVFVDAGGLMSYGPSFSDLFRRAATYVDKILKGAKPADLPVEQPTKFELVINLKTAKALGLTIPPSVLARADEVIE
jgi:putative ABC transport system substrate-binding protein